MEYHIKDEHGNFKNIICDSSPKVLYFKSINDLNLFAELYPSCHYIINDKHNCKYYPFKLKATFGQYKYSKIKDNVQKSYNSYNSNVYNELCDLEGKVQRKINELRIQKVCT